MDIVNFTIKDDISDTHMLHMLHVWNIDLNLGHSWGFYVGRYSSTMEHMGYVNI